ncbi:MAG: prepilin peptidase [Candidatus Ratteibacteria bacterium]|nr:prepilin peptidase [Candidatus Ratteibacteria bacterium]
MFKELIAFIFGLPVGSFLNVCIYRLPKGESVVNPPSHCPKCNKKIEWFDNIPLISYLILRGKCRNCKATISPRYFFVELLTGLLFYFLMLKFGLSLDFFMFAVFTCILIVVTFIDFDHFLIPDVLVLPGIVLGLAVSFKNSFLIDLPPLFFSVSYPFSAFLNSLTGAILGFVSLLAVAVLGELLFKKEAMGGGDLKLLAMIGAFLGWRNVFFTIFLSSLVGAVIGITMVILKKRGRLEYIPYGPYLALAAIISVFWGDILITKFLYF